MLAILRLDLEPNSDPVEVYEIASSPMIPMILVIEFSR